MKLLHLALFAGLPFLLSTTCKKDYYSGTEFVLLKATLNKTNETIHQGDTLKITFVLPDTLTSESGVMTPVRSAQKTLYNIDLFQIDTLNTNVATGAIRVTRIVSPSALVVSEGSMSPYGIGSVLASTAKPPFKSVLNIVAPIKGVYYIIITKGALKVNDSYEAFLRVNFAVPDKHWTLADKYIAGYSTAPEIISVEADGYANYWFRVK